MFVEVVVVVIGVVVADEVVDAADEDSDADDARILERLLPFLLASVHEKNGWRLYRWENDEQYG
jgi:hypothetical protein